MKRLAIIFASLGSTFASADSDTFSKDRLVSFYEEFLCQEKNDLYDAGLTAACTLSPNPYTPPPDPGPPPFQMGLLPIVIANNSGYADSEVFVVVTGKTTDATHQVFLDINTSTGIGTLHNVMSGENGSTYSYALSSLPATSDGHVFYVPEIISSLIWFSIEKKLDMPVNGSNEIVQPSTINSGDSNYTTNFDIFEFTYLTAGSPPISADATAVTAFSIPLYGYLADATSVASHTGLYQPRSYIISQVAATFNTAPEPERTEWNKLILTDGGTILRISSPGKAISIGTNFDINYLDNSSAYGYSYIEDIWSGANAYYKEAMFGGKGNVLTLTVGITNPSTATYTYTGTVDNMNLFNFTSSDMGAPMVTPFPAPNNGMTPTDTTTYNIFSALQFYAVKPTAGTADDAVSKLVQEAIVAGIIPTTSTISVASLTGDQAGYYQTNPNLTAPGGTTGPWYCLYSKGLHALGSIYAYGYDDALWPQVLLGGPFIENSTYLGITIGPVK